MADGRGWWQGRKRVVPVPPLALTEMLPEWLCEAGSRREAALVGAPRGVEADAQEALLQTKLSDSERAFQAGRMAGAVECAERMLDLMELARKKTRG